MAAPERHRDRWRPGTARYVLGWALLWLTGIHVAVHTRLEQRHPEVYDPEFAARLSLLRQRLAESPDRPLLLVVGSSRMVTDFVPERLPALPIADGTDTLAFNFSHYGAGPLLNLMEIRRVFREGVRPRWLVVEMLPPMLGTSGCSTASSLAVAGDLPLLQRHMPAWKAYGRYLGARLMPSTQHYLAALDLPYHVDGLPSLDRLGGSAVLDRDPTPDHVERWTSAVRSQYFRGMQTLHVTSVAEESITELLDFCRGEGVEVVLVLTPESSEFRSWYGPGAESQLHRFCGDLRRRFGVRVIDGRAWLRDDDFFDAHHALPHGAEAFTQQLAREVLAPLVAGDFSARP